MKYIAFDFGDGTTSAASYDGNGTPKTESILMGDEEVPSLLNYLPTENGKACPVIGNKAVSIGDTPAGLRMNWKSRPTQMEVTPGYPDKAKIADNINFMQTVYEEFCRANPGMITPETRVVIGTPSAWEQKDRDIYKEYAEKAGLKNVLVVSESQAAYLYAQKFLTGPNGDRIPSTVIKDGLLVIDVGSSTTDFTFTRGMFSEHYGIALGAKYIDNNLYKYGISNAKLDSSILDILNDDRNRELKLRLIFKCREIKEQYFTNSSSGGRTVRISGGVSEFIGDEEVRFYLGNVNKVTISEDLFSQLLDKDCDQRYLIDIKDSDTGNIKRDCWRGHFRAALLHVAQTLIDTGNNGRQKTTIVLTGGASRMFFIEDDIRSIFGSNVQIFAGSDKDRSFSVVKGLVWSGYACAKIGDFYARIEEIADKYRNEILSAVQKEFLTDQVLKKIRSNAQSELHEDMCKGRDCVRSRSKIRTRLSSLCEKYIEHYISSAEVIAKKQELFDKFRLECATRALKELTEEFNRVDVPIRIVDIRIPEFSMASISVSGIDLQTCSDDFRRLGNFLTFGMIGPSKEDMESEWLSSEKLKSIAGYLGGSHNDSNWADVENSIKQAMMVSGKPGLLRTAAAYESIEKLMGSFGAHLKSSFFDSSRWRKLAEETSNLSFVDSVTNVILEGVKEQIKCSTNALMGVFERRKS